MLVAAAPDCTATRRRGRAAACSSGAAARRALRLGERRAAELARPRRRESGRAPGDAGAWLRATFVPVGARERPSGCGSSSTTCCRTCRRACATRSRSRASSRGSASARAARARSARRSRGCCATAGACSRSLAFAARASTGFGLAVKRWRFFADVAIDLGLVLELAAASFGRGAAFVLALCLANVAKALGGVAAGASNSAIGVHFAGADGDVGETVAKGGAINTLSGLAGLALALALARALDAAALAPARARARSAASSARSPRSTCSRDRASLRCLALRHLTLERAAALHAAWRAAPTPPAPPPPPPPPPPRRRCPRRAPSPRARVVALPWARGGRRGRGGAVRVARAARRDARGPRRRNCERARRGARGRVRAPRSRRRDGDRALVLARARPRARGGARA